MSKVANGIVTIEEIDNGFLLIWTTPIDIGRLTPGSVTYKTGGKLKKEYYEDYDELLDRMRGLW